MNKTTCLIILTSLFVYSLSAQTNPQSAINLRPFATIYGLPGINFETMIGENSGIAADLYMGNYYNFFPNSQMSPDPNYFRISSILSYRYHFKHSLEGFFIAPASKFLYQNFPTIHSEKKACIKAFYLGANIGTRKIWDNGFNMTLRVGYNCPVYYDSYLQNLENNSGDNPIEGLFYNTYDYLFILLSGFDAELSVGYAF